MSKPIITILGASGNIGQVCVPFFANQGYQVRAVGRSLPKFKQEGVENLAVDYDDLEALTKSCEGTKAFICLIGLEYKASIWEKDWPPLVHNLIEVAKKTNSKLIFFDNVYAYGLVEGKMLETSSLNAQTKKGLVRQKLDEMILEAVQKGEIKAVTAKSADFYGPKITTSVIGERFVKLIKEKNQVEIFGNPQKIHNYTYILDIPPALQKLIESDFVGNIHLPTATALTGYQIKDILEKITGKQLALAPLRQSTVFWLRLFIPILKELYDMMYQSENDYDFDSSKILKLFPDLKVTTYEDGFRELLASFSKID
jgi:nucleoside-diphosphate-sugar epimerase